MYCVTAWPQHNGRGRCRDEGNHRPSQQSCYPRRPLLRRKCYHRPEPTIVLSGWFTSPRSHRTPMKRLRRSSPISRGPTSSPTSKSRMDVSGCVRRAQSIFAATFRSRSRSSFGQPRAPRNPICSRRKSGGLPGGRSRVGTSSPNKTEPFILIWSASSPSAWAQPPLSVIAATCRCFHSQTSCST